MEEQQVEKRFWSLGEVAEAVGRSYQTVYQLYYRGRLPRPAQRIGKTWLFTQEDILRLMQRLHENKAK